jgi:cytochrome P450
VVDEALRLYPPVWINNRQVLIDDEIDGVVMPKGSLVFMLPYIVHRHPEYWDNPEAFIPERFAPERSTATYHEAYMPFGGGPRSCIGNHFALMEVQLVLATLAQRYSVRLAPGTLMRLISRGTLHPEGGLPMTLHRR